MTDYIACNTCGHTVNKPIRETVDFLKSRLCANCNRIYESPPEVCPYCSDTQSISIPTYFGRNSNKIELPKAKFCSDCKHVSETEGLCPVCGGNKILELRSVLDQSRITDKVRGITTEEGDKMSISKVFKLETLAQNNIEVYVSEGSLALGFIIGDQTFDILLTSDEVKDLQKMIRLTARSMKVKE